MWCHGLTLFFKYSCQCKELNHIRPYLADIDAGVLLVVSPVAQCQAKLLLAVLPAQLHLLSQHTPINQQWFKPNMFSHGAPVRSLCFPQWIWWIPKPYQFKHWVYSSVLQNSWNDTTRGRWGPTWLLCSTLPLLITLGVFCCSVVVNFASGKENLC